MIPIIINQRDLLTTVIEQVKFFSQIPDTLICICDNASTYPPLLDWYASGIPILTKLNIKGSGVDLYSIVFDLPPTRPMDMTFQMPFKINLFKLPDNRGPRGSGVIPDLIPWEFDYYFLSDPDLDYTGIDGADMFHYMQQALKIIPDIHGAGVSLRLDDLPDTQAAEHARHVEAGNWINHYGSEWYDAPCDTAGVMRRRVPHWDGSYKGVRSVRHVARHRPWYFMSSDIKSFIFEDGKATGIFTPPDFEYFYAHANPRGTCYTARVLDKSRPL